MFFPEIVNWNFTAEDREIKQNSELLREYIWNIALERKEDMKRDDFKDPGDFL